MFSPHGRVLASTHDDGKIRQWRFTDLDIERYIESLPVKEKLLVFALIKAVREKQSLSFLENEHIKALFNFLDADLILKLLSVHRQPQNAGSAMAKPAAKQAATFQPVPPHLKPMY